MEYMEQEKNRFKAKLETFFDGCDALEEQGAWDLEENGQMDGFYQNDLMCFILRVTAADSFISKEETALVNELFDCEYSPEELTLVYESCRDIIESQDFETRFTRGLTMMENINSQLADAYRELLMDACVLIMHSDHFATVEEKAECRRIAALLKGEG